MMNTTQLVKKNRSDSIRLLVIAAMFAAIVTLTTAYLFHIPVGTAGGYIHLGDAFIYLAASFLPMPYAIAAASIGAGLADCVSGAMIWMLPTIIIKALMVIPFTSKGSKVLCKRNVIASIISGIICMGGYYLAEAFMMGNMLAPLAGLWAGFIQSGGGAVAFLLMAFAIDKAKLKEKLGGHLS